MKKWNKMKSNITDEELNYKFMNGYNLFYQEDSEKITIVGMKKNLLFYLTSSCSSKDIPMVKTIKTRCNDMAWYILECPFFRTEEGRCILSLIHISIEDLHLVTTINIQPNETTKIVKKLSKLKSGLETERYNKVKQYAKQQMNYEYMKDKKLETKLDDVTQMIEDLSLIHI